jgi:NAD(P)H-nitrite reductase large subunit
MDIATNRITVIGAGISGRRAIEGIRKARPDSKITVIDKEPYSIPRAELISSPGNISRKAVLSEWAESMRCEFIEARVERVSLRRRKIYFKEADPRDFDILVVATGLGSKKISVKGDHREGFFYLSDIDPFLVRDLLKISSESAVEVSSWLGIKLAWALRNLGKEVRIVSAGLDFLGEYSQRLIQALQERNILFHLGARIEEGVGEGRIKAAKISPLKVVSSQLIFIDSGFIANRGFFEEDIMPGDHFFTGHQDVYLLGDSRRGDLEGERFFTTYQKEAEIQADSFVDYLTEGKPPLAGAQDQEHDAWRKEIEDFLRDLESESVKNTESTH